MPVGSDCTNKVPGCSNYSPQGCTQCLISYTLVNGLCQVKYCNRYTTPDNCIQC